MAELTEATPPVVGTAPVAPVAGCPGGTPAGSPLRTGVKPPVERRQLRMRLIVQKCQGKKAKKDAGDEPDKE